MADTPKYLGKDGVQYLWQKMALRTPNADTTIWSGVANAIADLKNTPYGAFKIYILYCDVDSEGNIQTPWTGTYGTFSSTTTSALFGNTNTKGFSCGDLIIVLHNSEPSDDSTKCELVGMLLPTQDAKAASGDFVGADGLETIWDKTQVNKVPTIETTAGTALNGHTTGSYYTNALGEAGWYATATSGRSGGDWSTIGNDDTGGTEEYYMFNSAHRKYSNGYSDFLQYAVSKKDPTKAFVRIVSWNDNTNAYSSTLVDWKSLIIPDPVEIEVASTSDIDLALLEYVNKWVTTEFKVLSSYNELSFYSLEMTQAIGSEASYDVSKFLFVLNDTYAIDSQYITKFGYIGGGSHGIYLTNIGYLPVSPTSITSITIYQLEEL